MPLRVVLLVDDLEVWGGTETHLRRLAEELDPARVRIHLASVGRSALATEFRASGVPVTSLGIYRTFAASGLAGVGRVARLLRRERADLLVTYHTAADLLGPLAARLAGIPVLSCRRDEGFTKKAIHTRAQRLVNPLLRGMIAVSHAVARAVEQSEGYPRRRVQVIWNGEDLARFAPGPSEARAELGLGPDAVLLTSVGSLTPVKEHGLLLEAFAALAGRHPRARLLLVGDGPLRTELQARASRLAPGRVLFLGHRKDVPDLLRASDIYVQASRTEGFSNAILQAMACGLPVVATRVGGNPELVTPECGALVKPGDARVIEAALEPLVGDATLRRAAGRAARRRAEDNGSLQVMVEAYSDAFERAVRGDFPGPSSGMTHPPAASDPTAGHAQTLPLYSPPLALRDLQRR